MKSLEQVEEEEATATVNASGNVNGRGNVNARENVNVSVDARRTELMKRAKKKRQK